MEKNKESWFAFVLRRMIRSKDKRPWSATEAQAMFEVNTSFPLADYVTRIRKYTIVSESCFIVALIYIQASSLPVTRKSIFYLLSVCLLLAQKYLEDRPHGHAAFARICGVTPAKLAELERYMLQQFNYSIYVDPLIYHRYVTMIKKHCARLGLSLRPC